MDFLELQIKFHTDIIEVHKNHIKLLKETYKIPDTNKSSNNTEKYIDDTNKSSNNTEKYIDGVNKFNMIVNGLDDQEVVWDRIRNAHPDRYNTECVNLSKEPIFEPIVETIFEPIVEPIVEPKKINVSNNKNNIKIPNSNKLFQDMLSQVQTQEQQKEQKQEHQKETEQKQEHQKETEQKQEQQEKTKEQQKETEPVKIIKVSRLSKFNDTKQHQIIKNIYTKAKLNMEKLSELDNDIKLNIEQKINEEADRLLEAYLNEPNGS